LKVAKQYYPNSIIVDISDKLTAFAVSKFLEMNYEKE
tara:strand:+ start:134 stop:244 length:111 start_codon:yes stop_codon:yes gene_type:complete